MKRFILATILFGLSFCAPQTPADLTLRKTQFGMVQGAKNEVFDSLYWKDIPYAKAAIGELRWKKPLDPDPWKETMLATNSGAISLQMVNGQVGGLEDSLNLDIYRPNTATAKLPVLVFIHGGNNQGGRAEEITGESFVKEMDVVYISINYRLGVLGFNPLPALNTGNPEEDSGNYSLLDIAKALDWVKNNISQFGGDPNNITISGFSAGGRDVMALLISPMFKGKFHKAISFSGGMSIADKEKSIPIVAESLAPLALEDKMQPSLAEAKKWLMSSGSDVREYLHQIAPERLIPLMGNAGIRMAVFPHLFNDGVVLPKEGFKTQNYNSVPLMMLTGSREFSMFANGDPYFVKNTASSKEKEYEFASLYGSKLYNLFNVSDSAAAMAPAYKNNIYGVEIRFGDDEAVVGEKMGRFGAFHGVFVPLLSTNNENYSWLGSDEGYNSQGAKELGSLFRSYLRNFLVSGNPNGAGLPMWEQWAAAKEGKSLLILDANKEKASALMGNPQHNYTQTFDLIRRDASISPAAKKKIISEVLNGRWFSKELDSHFQNTNIWIML